jgi:hypothetical protein
MIREDLLRYTKESVGDMIQRGGYKDVQHAMRYSVSGALSWSSRNSDLYETK